MVVDGFEILHLDAIPEDVRIRLATNGDIPHQIFDENRILVGLFGDMFFIGTLQQAEKLGAGGLLGHQMTRQQQLAQLALLEGQMNNPYANLNTVLNIGGGSFAGGNQGNASY